MPSRSVPSLRALFRRLLFGAFFLPAALLVLVAGGGLAVFQKHQIEENQRLLAQSLASDTATYLDAAARRLVGLSKILSQSPWEQVIPHVETSWKDFGGFEALYILDPAGRLVFSTPHYVPFLEAQSFPGRDSSEKSQGVQVSLPFLSPRSGHLTVRLLRPIPAGGYVAGDLDLKGLEESLAALNNRASSQKAFVVDRLGNPLAHPDPKVSRNQANLLFLKPLLRDARDKTTSIYEDKGILMQGALAEVPPFRWKVMVYGPVRELYYPVVVISAVTLVAVLFLALMSSSLLGRIRRRIAEPLEYLIGEMRSAARDGEGGRESPGPAVTFKELADLVRYYTKMRALQKATSRRRIRQIHRSQAFQQAIYEMSTHPALIEGRILEAQEFICRVTAKTLEVSRALVWRLEGSRLVCLCGSGETEACAEEAPLDLSSQPDLIRREGRVLSRIFHFGDASAPSDPGSFPEAYMHPRGVKTLVLVPIRQDGGLFGYLMLEDGRAERKWEPDEMVFAAQAGELFTRSLIQADLHARTRELHNLAETLDKKVQKRTRELETLYTFSKEMGFVTDEETFASLVFSMLRRVLQVDVAGLSLEKNGTRCLYLLNTQPLAPEFRSEVLEQIFPGLHPEESQETSVVELAAPADPDRQGAICALHSVCRVPLMADRQVLGHLAVGRRNTQPFSREEWHFVSLMGRQIGESLYRLYSLLHAEEERLQDLLENLPQGVVLFDGAGSVRLSNKTGLAYLEDMGVADSALPDTGPLALQALLDRCDERLPLEISSSTGAVYEIHVRHLLSRKQPLHVLTIQDVTEERRVENQIRQQDRLAAVGQLAAGIAHDFNNLLMGIMMQAQVLQLKGVPPQVAHGLDTIVNQGQRAAHLIQQILDFSRESISRKGPLDLKPLVKETLKILERTIEENVSIRFQDDGSEYMVEADPTQIQQIVTNMALNARDAMPQGGTFRVGLERIEVSAPGQAPLEGMMPGRWIRISFQDTETGIAKEHLPHVFEPFFTTKEVGKGTGLGLSQVYGIVKQHGGHVTVESSQGQGTLFTVYLPALRRPSEETTTSPADSVEDHGAVGEVVLLVEDEPQVLLITREILEALGYTVLTAANGREALEVLRSGGARVDALVTDMVMPDMGGRELIEAVRAQDPAFPIVVVTGYPLDRQAREMLRRGGIAWLAKPTTMGELAETLRAVLDQSATRPCNPPAVSLL
jgi:signal transduction histidine kinase/CheY-like chemotaxis protein